MDYTKLKFNDLRAAARKAGMFNASTAKAQDMREYLIERDKTKEEDKITKPTEFKKIPKKKIDKVESGVRKAKKHYQMFVLSQQGKSNAEIAAALGTNVGHVWNELNKYKKDPKRAIAFAV